MDLTGYGIIKIIDKKQVKDRITGKDILLSKLYVVGDAGDTFFLWSQKDWSEFIDTPACFVLAVGNKGKGFYLRIVDILPKDLPKPPRKMAL